MFFFLAKKSDHDDDAVGERCEGDGLDGINTH
jgi:hypothetical protein